MSDRLRAIALCVALGGLASVACAQPSSRDPYVGYVYPAGAQQGTVAQVAVGGQFLRGANSVYVSGDGVRATIVKFSPPLRPPDAEQVRAIRDRLAELIQQRLPSDPAERLRLGIPPGLGGRPGPGRPANQGGAAQAGKAGEEKPVPLPDLPLLRDLDQKNLQELVEIGKRLRSQRNLQPIQRSIAETVMIEVTVDRNATLGPRELRLGTPAGLTNPIRLDVGQFPEVRESEPNDPAPLADRVVDLPAVLNGQITPGDVDLLRFRAEQGQQLVIATEARALMPYLADAVPGWFQAVLTLCDSDGHELAYADAYGFDPDPVLHFSVPKDGEYRLEVRDALYRGRDDFVYRVTVAEQPFITWMFPLGAREGTETTALVGGWNLPSDRLPLDTKPGADPVREAAASRDGVLSNRVPYAVDATPSVDEVEPNDTPDKATRVDPPVMANGRIGRPGDVDFYRFDGRAGDEVVAEVFARRLRSPLDSLLRLCDSAGAVVAWNDDHEDRGAGLLTHHADSYIRAKLPADGAYYVRVTDAEHHGGDDYGYRLRIGAPHPDFALRVTPASVNIPAGHAAVVHVHALREDGFDGDVEVALVGAPPGFSVSGGRIPRGRDSVPITVAAPRPPLDKPIVLRVEGRAVIGGETVNHEAVPAEDRMQAFAYRQLVPARDLMVAVTGQMRAAPSFERPDSRRVRIPAGGTAQVQFSPSRSVAIRDIRFELSDPPKGISLKEMVFGPGGPLLTIAADPAAVQVGYADNLIVEAFTEIEVNPPPQTQTQPGQPGQKPGTQPAAQPQPKPAARKVRVSIGVLPAVPFEIVAP